MADISIEMLKQSLNAFINNDAEQAKKIGKMDSLVDELHAKFINEEYNIMMKDPKLIKQSINLLFLSRFIERFGDHVTNICEWIVYCAAGEHVSLNG
jgi:phosphate transport system protein